MIFTRKIAELNKNNTDVAGGKGASLGEMAQAGIPVPLGFVVLSNAFEKFIQESNLVQKIDAILSTVDYHAIHTLEVASKAIRTFILNTEIPKDIACDILNQFTQLDVEYVAVRSSATAEDGKDHAWAGQLESYLNTTEVDLLANVKLCWSSLFTSHAMFYRFEKGLDTIKISVAVVIQKMVESEISGIAFSVHPVTQDKNQVIIEAGFGLGEALVSGQITPDAYTLTKEPRGILDIKTSPQRKGLFKKQGGGNEWRDLTESQIFSQKLNKEQILELSDIVLRIENQYGFPCDVEWAYEKDKFYITQSRPITTLSKNKKVLVDMGSRERSLIYAYVLSNADSKDVKRAFGFDLTIVVVGEGSRGKITTWYQPDELSEVTKLVIDKIKIDTTFLQQIKKDFFERWEKLLLYVKRDQKIESFSEAYEVYELYYLWWSSLSYVLDANKISEEMKKEYQTWRVANERHTEEIDKLFVEYILKQFPQYTNIVNLITPDEMLSLDKGSFGEEKMSEIQGRSDGFVLYNERTYPISCSNKLFEKEHIVLDTKEPDQIYDSLQGVTASVGKVIGRVRIVKYKEDLRLLEEGEILIVGATTPDYVSAIKKAGAVVTDEGGMMSHAAITCRELKKTCVVGTTWSTKTFKTGEMVEVDAVGEAGIVRRLSK